MGKIILMIEELEDIKTEMPHRNIEEIFCGAQIGIVVDYQKQEEKNR